VLLFDSVCEKEVIVKKRILEKELERAAGTTAGRASPVVFAARPFKTRYGQSAVRDV
jgi:hypothetical protein